MPTDKPKLKAQDRVLISMATLFPHVGAIGKGYPLRSRVRTGTGDLGKFSRQLKPGDILLTGRQGVGLHMFTALGTGAPKATHAMMLERVGRDGSLHVLHNEKGIGFTRTKFTSSSILSRYDTLSAYRPVNNKVVLSNMKGYVDTFEKLRKALKKRKIPDWKIDEILAKSYRGGVAHAKAGLRSILLPNVGRSRIKKEQLKHAFEFSRFKGRINSYADDIARDLLSGKAPNLKPIRKLSTNCSWAIAASGLDVGIPKPLSGITPADLAASRSTRSVGLYRKMPKSLYQAMARRSAMSLKFGPHLIRGGIGLGLGAVAYSALKKRRVKAHNRRLASGKLVRIESYSRKGK
jgi:hypothetical protein